MNININYYGQGKPLVFFHGWGFDHQVWIPLIPLLKNKYQLILVDLPGFGLTPMMDWEVFKTNLLSQLPPEFALAGWSMGGLYATRLALEAPNRVRRLVNITSSPRFIMEGSWPGVDKAVFLNFHNNLASDPQSTLKDFVSLQVGKNNANVTMGILPSVEGLKSGLYLLDAWDLREGIKSLTLPTCYMFGRLDPITPVKTMQTMQVLYPDFNYIFFKKSAHMPFLSDIDLFVKELMEFIK